MSNLLQFIVANSLLCSILFITIIIYLSYELWSINNRKINISTQDAVVLINREKGIVLDIRSYAEYSEAHIIGAIHSTLDKLKSSTKILEKCKKTPIIICNGNGVGSKSTFIFLKRKNFSKIFIIKGGFASWYSENLPVDRVSSPQNLIQIKKKKEN
jgi:thiosulfate/3-mercaptopyruvate sulfurtransferase